MTLYVVVEHEKVKEPAGGADRSRDGGRRQAVAGHARNPLAQVFAVKFLDRLVICFGPRLQLRDVAGVTLQRVSGQAFFDLNVSKEFANEIAIRTLAQHRDQIITGSKSRSFGV